MLTQFLSTLESLGRTDQERARRLGLSVRSISRLKARDLPEQLERLMNAPELLEALAADARQSQGGSAPE